MMTDVERADQVSWRRVTTRWVIALAVLGAVLLTIVAIRSLRVQHSVAEDPSASAARNAIAHGNYEQAETAIKRWLSADPDAAEAYYLQARVDLARDRGKEAIESMGSALKLGYPQAPLSAVRAVLMARAGKNDEAETPLAQALSSSDTPQPEVAEALAKIYLATFRIDAARRAVHRWIKDAPDDARPYVLLNEIEDRLDTDHPSRIANFRAALQRDPNLFDARLGLANALLSMHQLDESFQEFERCREARPENPEVWIGLGRIAVARGDLATAKRQLDQALKLAPKNPQALRARSLVALHEQDLPQARSFLERELAVSPHAFESRLNLASVLNKQRFTAEAREQSALAQKDKAKVDAFLKVRAALVTDPTNRDLRLEAARRVQDLGNDEEFVRWLELVLRDHPSDAEAHRLLANYYRREGNLGQANYHELMIPERATK